MECWNLSSGNLNSYKDSLIHAHERLLKSALSRCSPSTSVRGWSHSTDSCCFCYREEQNQTPFFNFNLCFWCFCSLKRYCQYIMSCLGGTPPLLLNVKWKCLWNQSAFVQGNILTLSTCCWLQEGRNTHIPFQRLAFPGDICKTDDLFTLLHHLLPLSVLQKKLASRPW